MGYEISKIIVVRFNNNHVPYIKGLLVKGPKNEKYLLDEFNGEFLVKNLLGNKDNFSFMKMFDFRISNLLLSFGSYNKRMIVLNEDLPLDMLSMKYEAQLLVRQSGIEYTQKMCGENDCKRLKQFILDKNNIL